MIVKLIKMTIRKLYPKVILAVLQESNFLTDLISFLCRIFEKICEKKRISGNTNLRDNHFNPYSCCDTGVCVE